MSTDRSVLLLGGGGQVGREIREWAWPTGWTVSAPTRAELDLNDEESVASSVRARPWTAIVNAAAYTAVDQAESDEETAWAVNARAPGVLATASGALGIPLIHISTDYVFDGTGHGAYSEDDATNPLGVYGRSKLAGEEAIRAGNPRHLIVRTAWVFGQYGGNFVKTMLRLARDRPTINVVDDQRGTPTCAADLAGALGLMTCRIVDDPGRWGTYHFANSGETTWCGFARRIFDLSNRLGGPSAEVVAIGTDDYPTPAKRPANSCLSTAKIARDFAIHPRPYEAALEEVLTSLSASGFR